MTRARQIWRVPLNASSLVAKVGVFAQLHGGLGGPDGATLFITESQTGSILTVRMPAAGQTLFSHH